MVGVMFKPSCGSFTAMITCTRLMINSWFHASNCNSDSDTNKFFNDTVCAEIVSALPGCLDAVQSALEQPILEHKQDALAACMDVLLWHKAPDKDPYDFRTKVR